MRLLHLAAVGTLGLASLACGFESNDLPAQPTPAASEPRPEAPPQPPPNARRIEVGAVISDELTNPDVPVGCPPLGDPYPGALMPCRHFEVVAPGDGVLRVQVVFTPNDGAEGVELVVAGVTQDNRANFYAPVGTHRVLAGATYGITVAYNPSHYEFVVLGPDRIGQFTLQTTFEPRTWR